MALNCDLNLGIFCQNHKLNHYVLIEIYHNNDLGLFGMLKDCRGESSSAWRGDGFYQKRRSELYIALTGLWSISESS